MNFEVEEEVEVGDASSRELREAQGLILAYTQRFSEVTGDRDAVAIIREQLRQDENFWQLSAKVIELVEGKAEWISAIFRAEGKRAHRQYAGRMEEIRLEREAKRQAEKLAEQQEMEQLSNFGMF